jgi:hypothetical protein
MLFRIRSGLYFINRKIVLYLKPVLMGGVRSRRRFLLFSVPVITAWGVRRFSFPLFAPNRTQRGFMGFLTQLTPSHFPLY